MQQYTRIVTTQEQPILNNAQKPFWDHLGELRDRFMAMLYALLATSIVGYYFRMPVLEFLKAPLLRVLPSDRQNLYFTGVFENFFNHLQISILIGVFLGAPYFLYQIWAFVAPALHKHERRLVWPFIIAGTVFFFSGAGFAYYVVLPYGFKFFISFGGPIDVPMITIKEYFGALFRILLLFGVCFELPVVLVLLAKLGLVNSRVLTEQRRNVVIGITVVSALLAPPDVVSMLLMMAPLYLFFEGALLVIRLVEKKSGTPGTKT